MDEGKFRESARAELAVDSARAQLLAAAKRRNQASVQQDVQRRQAESQQEYEEFCQEMKQKEQDLELRIKEQTQQMRERHERERDEHDADWKVEPKQRQFNRASQKLRILRVQQQLLMNSRRFDEAAQVCKIADRLVAAEAAESHFRLLTEFQASRTVLEQRQSDELDTLLRACDVARQELSYMKEKANRRFLNRFAALQVEEEAARDADRLWVLKHRNDGDQIVNLCGTTRTRGGRLSKAADVTTFNTLPLPPLPALSSGRKRAKKSEK
jgi:hypothetical protein